MTWLIALVPLLFGIAMLLYDLHRRRRHGRRKRMKRRGDRAERVKREWWVMRWMARGKQKRLENRHLNVD